VSRRSGRRFADKDTRQLTDTSFTLRRYAQADEAAAIELWRRTWQHAYPQIDFAARTGWWRERWRNELVPTTIITLAERDGALIGLVTVDPHSGYLDQIVVAPETWGSPLAAALVDEAKRIAPGKLDLLVNQDNARAIRFYEKHGFAITGADLNERSGALLHRMSWRENQES
jgi:putative acetyltransferase